MWDPESERRGWKQRKVLCIQLLKSCSTPWWQTNKQNPCLFFSAQWLQQTHSASFRLARQLALLTKTNSRDVFSFSFFFYISWFNSKGLPHSHLFPYHQSRDICVSTAIVSGSWNGKNWGMRGEKSRRCTAHTEQLFSFKVTHLNACAERKLRKLMLPQQLWCAPELPPKKGVSDVA